MTVLLIFSAEVHKGIHSIETGNQVLLFVVDKKLDHCEYDEIKRYKGDEKPRRSERKDWKESVLQWGIECIAPDCENEPDQFHHVLPRYRGGVTAPRNLVPLCDYHHGEFVLGGSKHDVSHPTVYEADDIGTMLSFCDTPHIHWHDDSPECDHGPLDYILNSWKIIEEKGEDRPQYWSAMGRSLDDLTKEEIPLIALGIHQHLDNQLDEVPETVEKQYRQMQARLDR